MTREELRNAINNACDIMRREGLTTIDYMEKVEAIRRSTCSPSRRCQEERVVVELG